jgi:hypothetical protein
MHLALRVSARWRRLVFGAFLLGAAGTVLTLVLSRPVYVAEAFAVLHPQEQSDELAGKLDLDEEIVFAPRPLENYMARPVDVVDIQRLARSQQVLESTASRYAEALPERSPLATRQLASMLSVETRLVLKTPYQVRYSPLLTFRARAADEEIAREVLAAWASAVETAVLPVTLGARLQRAFEAVEQEYAQRSERLANLGIRMRELEERGDGESAVHVAELAREYEVLDRATRELGASMVNVSAVLARTQPEFTFMKMPARALADSPLPGWPVVTAFWSILALVALAVLQALALLLHDTAASLRREDAAGPNE